MMWEAAAVKGASPEIPHYFVVLSSPVQSELTHAASAIAIHICLEQRRLAMQRNMTIRPATGATTLHKTCA